MPSSYFAYIRVSTLRQGRGVSLDEQREHIERYAAASGIVVARWFVDRETAAERGRKAFTEMLRELRRGGGGVVVHKVDRSARNYHDWADIHDLADLGIDVRFTTEGIDLRTRGGRLSADIQAVVAVDYVRNLREEVIKGLYGRLKTGIYPFGAPLGYRDEGGGKLKTVDPVAGPLMRQAFELYATGRYTLTSLLAELTPAGLRSRVGKPLLRTSLARLLNNPFYAGIIRIKRSGKTFQGKHEPLVSADLWQRVQDTLHGRVGGKVARHEFTYRRLLNCLHCAKTLSGELQKGRVYYRCHTADCPTTTVREDTVDREMESRLEALRLGPDEVAELKAECLRQLSEAGGPNAEEARRVAELRLRNVEERIGRLLDLCVEGAFERETLERKKEALLIERMKATEEVNRASTSETMTGQRTAFVFELLARLSQCGRLLTRQEMRELVARLTSNRVVDGRRPVLTLVSPFDELSETAGVSTCGHLRDRLRTLGGIVAKWVRGTDPIPENTYTSITSYTEADGTWAHGMNGGRA